MDRPVVLQIIGDGAPGGGSTMLLGLLDDLKFNCSYEFVVVAPPNSFLMEQVQKRGIRCIGFDFSGSPFDFLRPQRLKHALREFGGAIVHAHGLRAAFTWVLGAEVNHNLSVYTLHGFHHLISPAWFRWLGDRAERKVMARARHTVFVSQSDRRIAWERGLLRTKSVTIPNGVRFGELSPYGKRGYPQWDVVFIGRMEAPKNPLLAAVVLNELASMGYRVAMIGQGTLESNVKAALTHGLVNATWMGGLTHTQALTQLSAARCVLMTSISEGFPLLPLEAMALGTCVVMTPFGSASEVLTSSQHGVILPNYDAQTIVQILIHLLNQHIEIERMTSAAKEYVERNFQRDKLSKYYLSLYRSGV